MNNKLLRKEEEFKDYMKIDLKISVESKNYVKLNIIFGENNNVVINEKPIEVEYIENTSHELMTEDLLEVNSKFEDEVYKEFYDSLDNEVKKLWNEIFDRTMKLDTEYKKYNKEAKLLLNYEYIDTIELQCFLTSEDIDFIKKVDDDTYEILIGDEVFSIKFI
ncbi:hypothetical protein CDLVIII_3204 [Clostridium sp. DL-VIII]|uniref:hypothetical protein n=1 Tax=Clostridium sp. DL-VIII TaxID=641107 RepID=UPI00023AFFD1|nr:hypothetical protein [Clostridium sp. DL-VIII]EHI99778.1 hypothetical protein CDLVIII_3204 [Clostridium sp. DL-VIII]